MAYLCLAMGSVPGPELLPGGGVAMATSVRSLSELLLEELSGLALRLDPLVLAGSIVRVAGASSVTRKIWIFLCSLCYTCKGSLLVKWLAFKVEKKTKQSWVYAKHCDEHVC